jgi:hypothetical protein
MSNDVSARKLSFAEMLGSASGVSSAEDTCVDIITFAEASWGFGMGTEPGIPALLPAQRWILKAFYGLPMDNTNKYIPIYDKFCETLLYSFTEVEFADYLYSEGRLNTKEFHGKHQMLALICGRRGTKTSVTSLIADYEIYKMLLRRHPQGYFGIFPDDIISMTCLSTTEENAKILYDRAVGNMERSPFFRDYMTKDPNQTLLTLRSQRDKEDFPDSPKKHTIRFVADACSAKGLRGPNNVFIALDEVAHFFKDASGKASSDKSDIAIYEAVKPSLAMFKNPDKTPAGRVVLISSPADKSGLLWDEYQRSFDPERGRDILTVQLPSWEMNPLIPSEFLRSEYSKNQIMFSTEYGAEFSDRLSGWLEDPSVLRRCFDEDLRLTERSNARTPFFLGGDVGMKNDATALAVVHIEEPGEGEGDLPVIVLDCYEEFFAKDEKTPEIEGVDPVFTPEEVAAKIQSVCSRFNIHKGLIDQYYQMSIIPLLKNKGITQVEYRHFNDSLNSDVYNNLFSKLVSKGIRLPTTGKYTPKGDLVDISLVTELLQLQALKKSKYQIKVFMPEGNNRHDDKSDAFARAVFLATEYINQGGTGMGKSSSSPRMASATIRAMARMQNSRSQRPQGGMIYKSGNRRLR